MLSKHLIPFNQSAPPSQADDDVHLLRLWLHGKSANTREAYGRDIRQFVDFIDLPFRQMRLDDLQQYSDFMEEKNLSPASRARKLATIKSLFSFGHKIGYVTWNVGAALLTPKVPDRLAERILDESTIQSMLHAEKNLRDRVLLRLFYATGGRVSELADLRWQSVVERTDGTGQVTLLGKGRKTRNVLLTKGTWSAINELKKEELDKGFGTSDDAVFRSRQGGSLTRMRIWQVVRKAAKNVGIDMPVSPHWLRHAHASHALDRGAPAHLVKDTLGHQSLATTSKYTHARPDDSSARYLAV